MTSTDYLSVNLDFASNKAGREKKVQNIELETLRQDLLQTLIYNESSSRKNSLKERKFFRVTIYQDDTEVQQRNRICFKSFAQ